MTKIKALLFDADNTLMASTSYVKNTMKLAIEKLKESGDVYVITPAEEEINKVLKENPPFEDIFKKLFPGVYNGRELWEIVIEKYRAIATDLPYSATSNAVDALKKLKKQGYVLGVVTARLNMLDVRLSQCGFNLDDFAFLSTPKDQSHKKPHPKAFEPALEELKKKGIDRNETVMFGDHFDDYFSAKGQGLHFIGVLQGSITKEEFITEGLEENLSIDDLSQCENVLKYLEKRNIYRNSLTNSSALDGRHGFMTNDLKEFTSEYALHKNRIKVEIEHIITLSEFFAGKLVREILPEEKEFLRNLYQNFTIENAYEVLQYDHLGRNGIGPTEHDVKSCEIWIQEKLKGTSVEDVSSFVHIFLTSEDVNNLAYKTMLRGALEEVFTPSVHLLTDRIKELAQKHIDDPVMGRTHIQPASPTTYGKIFGVYLSRLTDSLERLNTIRLTGKLNGAVGNYNTFVATYPEYDWISYSKELCSKMGFETEIITDQRGTHLDMIRAFSTVQEINNTLRDLATDLSLYAAIGTMYFSKIESHVGSSVMPHKINPWFAEVAEGNAKKANYQINILTNELDVSRLQRDLSDHDYERSYGEALGYVLVAMEHLKIALDLIRANTEFAKEELEANYQVVTEAIQTILRKYGNAQAYMLLKDHFRGKKITAEEIETFISSLNIDEKIKEELRAVSHPARYIGLAKELTEIAIQKYENYKQNLRLRKM
jgi:adenylosuccinate lyase